MNRVAVLLLLVAAPAARAGAPPLSGVIDGHVNARLAAAGVPAASPADDAEFFRRIHLALAGRIPTAEAARAFLADPAADKRERAVDALLTSPDYADHQTTLWRGWLLPEAAADPQIAAQAPGFEGWLRPRLAANVPFDKLVRELLTAPLDGQPSMRRRPADGPDYGGSPVAFYLAKDAKPENLAAATSRVFLGVQLECAQCHAHPFAKWTREQFWGMAAFFGGVERQDGGLQEVTTRREMVVPNTDRAVPATFLDDQQPAWRYKTSPRATLAEWVTAKANPFFARAAVNRAWGTLMGVGLVDPIDDFNDQNPASHPELLDDLAAAFAGSGFDLKALTRAIVLSDAYQRTSRATEPGQRDPRLFARFAVQGLSPEQLYDSLALVTAVETVGPPSPFDGQAEAARKAQFVEVFRRQGRPTETETTILQALALMNGGPATAVTLPPGLTGDERINAVYFALLGRPPTAAEQERLAAAGPVTPELIADLTWAVLNGIEFRTLH